MAEKVTIVFNNQVNVPVMHWIWGFNIGQSGAVISSGVVSGTTNTFTASGYDQYVLQVQHAGGNQASFQSGSFSGDTQISMVFAATT